MNCQQKKKPVGFTLVEVLVALVVLSVGLLGIASLYIVSLQSSGGAIYRFQAVNLASDFADRLRANPKAIDTYIAGAAANNNCVLGNPCTPDKMAQYDIFLGQKDIKKYLPNGSASVACQQASCSTPDALVNATITIKWYEPKAQSASSYVLNVQLHVPS